MEVCILLLMVNVLLIIDDEYHDSCQLMTIFTFGLNAVLVPLF
jgi:hypothetical protein